MYHNRLLCIIMRIFVKTKTDKMKEYLELKEKAEDNFMMSKTQGDTRFHLLVILALETGARVSDLLKINQTISRKKMELPIYHTRIRKEGKHKCRGFLKEQL